METAIPYFMTIIIIRINKYVVTSPRGPFKILPVLTKRVVHEPEEKLSIFGTTESDQKFGNRDCYTILYEQNNDLDQ